MALALAVMAGAAVALIHGGGQPAGRPAIKTTGKRSEASAPTAEVTGSKSTGGATSTQSGTHLHLSGAPRGRGGTAERTAPGSISGHAGSSPGGAGGATAAGTQPKGAVAVAEVRDPEESKSFPLPASVHHRSASSPTVAAEAAVAPGAASDAEIRKELGEEEHAKAQERAAKQRILTPAAGGFSVGGNGTIPIPANVPEVIQRVIAGGNAIADFPYIWGGGHASFIANGYDCSGSVSYALAAGGLLSAPLVSGDLANWGEAGPGRWITIYANAGHTFMVVDGMWFDTAGRSGPYASRWLVSQPSLAGYAVRHPVGL